MDSQSCHAPCSRPSTHTGAWKRQHPVATLLFENPGKVEPPRTWNRDPTTHLARDLGVQLLDDALEEGLHIRCYRLDSTAFQTTQSTISSTSAPVLYKRHSSRHPVAGAAAGLGRDRLRRSHAAGQAARPEHPQPPRQGAPVELPRSDQSGVQDGPLCRAGAGRVGAVERSPSVWPGRRNWPTIWSCCTQVIEQTQRRVLSGEAVAAQEKICSLFEEHTDIIKKSPRETVFGHMVFVSTGASSLILDCVVERGNPADSNYVQPFLERHRQLYGKVPRQSAWDGGFASAANLRWAQSQGGFAG